MSVVPTRALRIGRAGAIMTLPVLASCAPKKPEQPWQPPPQVLWTDVSDAPLQPVQDQYRIIEPTPSEGRFPCSVAVSRVAVTLDPDTGDRDRTVPTTPHNEFLIWNSAFDDLWPISEVFPVGRRDLSGGPVEPAALVDAACQFGARLVLLYGFNAATQSSAEMIGVLHSCDTGQPVAVLEASAESIPLPEDEKPARNNLDAWERDARALVRARFERLMVDCVRELIARDRPMKSDVPEGWIPLPPPPSWSTDFPGWFPPDSGS